jgi:hypothetical protein
VALIGVVDVDIALHKQLAVVLIIIIIRQEAAPSRPDRSDIAAAEAFRFRNQLI